MKQTKISVLGAGWVGRSMLKLFPDAIVYVRDVAKYQTDSSFPPATLFTDKKEEVNKADILFICVPTPLTENEQLDVSIIEEILEWAKVPLIVIRSTVNPGNCYKWSLRYKKNIVFQPEFLGETPNHPFINEKQAPFLIIGGKPADRHKLIDLYMTVYNANIKIRQMDTYTAEVCKLAENRAIAWKVMQIHELYEACEKSNTDFYVVRDAVYGDDLRMNLWFTAIYKNLLGFESSKCLKKDVPAFVSWAKAMGANPILTQALIKKSRQYDKQNKRRQKTV